MGRHHIKLLGSKTHGVNPSMSKLDIPRHEPDARPSFGFDTAIWACTLPMAARGHPVDRPARCAAMGGGLYG